MVFSISELLKKIYCGITINQPAARCILILSVALLWVCLFSVEMSFSFPESESNSFIHVSSLIIYSLAPLRHFWSGGKRRLKLNIPAPYSWLVYNWRNDWKPKNGWRNHRLQVDSLASLITATVVWVITVLWLNSYGWGGVVLGPGTAFLISHLADIDFNNKCLL